MFGENSKADDEDDLIDACPKLKELPIIQIFGFDGKTSIKESVQRFS